MVAFSLPLVLTAPVSALEASDDRSAAEREELVTFPFEPSDLPGFEYVQAAGARTAEGVCEITLGGGWRAREGQIEVGTEVSFDGSKCASTFAVAVYPIEDIPVEVTRSFLAGQVVQQPQPSTSDGRAANYARLWIAYRDPVLIPVTETETELTWTGTNSCITAASAEHDSDMVEQTGWVRTAYTETSTFTCSSAYANTYAKFKNDPFCPGSGNTTYANHTGTRVYGYPGGASTWSRTISKSGGCHNLLHSTYSWTP